MSSGACNNNMRTTASTTIPSDEQTPVIRNKGGWITVPFLAGSVIGVGMAMSATSSNLIVYLIREYNLSSIDAAQVSNVVRGCMQLAPVLGAVVSDAFFGCYPVVAAGVAISLLSFVVFTLTAALPSLRPPPSSCTPPPQSPCHPQRPSAAQAAVLYAAACLLAVGNGGTRYNTATLGADQFADGDGDGDGDGRRKRHAFFSWYFVFLYASYVAGDTALVYVQDSVSWAVGFGVCAATTGLGLVALLAGSRHYRRPVPRGSPFTALARVVVAAARKSKLGPTSSLGTSTVQYCYHHGSSSSTSSRDDPPSNRFQFLNRAAMMAPGGRETEQKPWRVCTVREVEDLKALLRVLPLWSSGILVSMTVNAQVSLTVLQALTMDRRVGARFAVPAASVTVAVLAAFVPSAALFDRLVVPGWERLITAGGGRRRQQLTITTPLRRIGLGHALNVASMAVAALVERRRIRVAHAGAGSSGGGALPMSAVWLVAQLALTGAEEALHLPGNTALFYQEFPAALRSTATAMPPLFIAVGSYLSTAFVDVVRRATGWLPDDLNRSRLDAVYWALTLVAALNLGYFLVCATAYQYKNDGDGKAHQIVDDKTELTSFKPRLESVI